jgi:hypothetical protein
MNTLLSTLMGKFKQICYSKFSRVMNVKCLSFIYFTRGLFGARLTQFVS